MLTRSGAVNPAFDITPARLVSAYVTDRGVIRQIADWNFGEAARAP
jgi:methylthioribose-1-phosphate isomerase